MLKLQKHIKNDFFVNTVLADLDFNSTEISYIYKKLKI